MNSKVAVLIVTYNSQKVLPSAMEALSKQTLPPYQVVIVDTGSENLDYLKPYGESILAKKGGGFCLGNNVGYEKIAPECDYVLLLNPDAFLFPDFIEHGVARMEQDSSLGALTGTTYGFSLEKMAPNGRYDTTGIQQTWYGKWYDRGQGQLVQKELFDQETDLKAICGAVFFLRKKALDQVLLPEGYIFPPHFYMYKEDIELSLRLSRAGWRLLFVPHLKAYHCRGWQGKRSAIPRLFRLFSAKNELSINVSEKKPLPIIYSVLKWGVVKFFNV